MPPRRAATPAPQRGVHPGGRVSPLDMRPASTLAERVLAHLRDHPYAADAAHAPPEVTQEGIAMGVGARVAHVSRALAGLTERAQVEVRLARTPGSKRRSRAYALTDGGRHAAAELQAPARAPTPAPATPAHVVLRPDELATLTRALDDALRAGPRVVLLEGDAGAGKTRLLAELHAHAQKKSVRWLAARAAPLGADQTLGPLHDALAPVGLDRRYQSLAAGTPLERARVASAQSLAAAAPTVLALDDVHLAGAGAVEFLRGVVAALPAGARVLVVCAFRREEAWELPNGPLYTALSPLSAPPSGSLLRLGPLPRATIRKLLFTEGHALDEKLVERVATESAGNPAYALAMADALRDGVDESDFFPPLVQSAVKERFDTLPREAFDVLQCAAACGVEFDLPTLQRVHEGPADKLVDALDVLIDRLLLEELDAGVRFRFEHPKVREAVVGEMTATRARWLSERVASAVSR